LKDAILGDFGYPKSSSTKRLVTLVPVDNAPAALYDIDPRQTPSQNNLGLLISRSEYSIYVK